MLRNPSPNAKQTNERNASELVMLQADMPPVVYAVKNVNVKQKKFVVHAGRGQPKRSPITFAHLPERHAERVNASWQH